MTRIGGPDQPASTRKQPPSILNGISYSNIGDEQRLNQLSPALVRLHSQLKALAQCHVVLGLIILILSALADYVSSRINTLRFIGMHECCAFYFMVTGIVGICGAASYRRGLVIAFLVMCLHAAVIFVPIIVIASSFDIHFYQHECWGQCDWPLLATSLPKDSRCQILCGEAIDENRRTTMTRLGTDYRLDAGIIAAALIEFFLSWVTAALCFRGVCELCGLVDRSALNQIVEITMLKRPADEEQKLSDPEPSTSVQMT
uniref:Uncharacterized protein n=1 Tax=Plectus sambesii TaxID=2011161 RepID=A0A914USB4_9BILA